MRAVVEVHGDRPEIPHLKIKICKGKEDLTIKVSLSLYPFYVVDEVIEICACRFFLKEMKNCCFNPNQP